MARLYQCGFELNSNTSGVEWTASTGGFATTTTNARSGTYCGRANASAASVYMYVVFRTDTVADAYLRTYIYIATAPSAQTTVMAYGDSSSFYGAKVKLNTDRTLTLTNSDGSLNASGSTVLATGTWYRLELYYDETNNQGTVRLDGATEIAATTIDDVGGGGKAIFGVFDATTADIYFDDIAINDTSGSYQTSWPGDGKIVHLKPNAAGDNTGWTAYIGTGANYERVDEITPNTNTDGVRSRVTDEIDDYNIEAFPGNSYDTINCIAVGFNAARSAGTTSSSMVQRIKAAASGTVDESSSQTPTSTAWRTNNLSTNNAAPYPLVSYKKPGTSDDWTPTDVDSAQIGVRCDSGSGDRYVQVTTLWASVDYSTGTPPASGSSKLGLLGVG